MTDLRPALNFVNIDKIRLENGQSHTITVLSMSNTGEEVRILDEFVIQYDVVANIPYILTAFFTKYIVDNYDLSAELVAAAYTRNSEVHPTPSAHGATVLHSYYDFAVAEFTKLTFYAKVYYAADGDMASVSAAMSEVDAALSS